MKRAKRTHSARVSPCDDVDDVVARASLTASLNQLLRLLWVFRFSSPVKRLFLKTARLTFLLRALGYCRGEGLNKTAIGDYLGEKSPFHEQVLKAFVDLHDFTDLILVQALR